MKYVFTYQENSKHVAINELREKLSTFKFLREIGEGVCLAEVNIKPENLSKIIYQTPIIFIRHLFEVQAEIEFDELFASKIISLAEKKLSKSLTFSIQQRSSGQIKRGIVNEISANLVKKGYKLDVKNCQQVISIYFADKIAYVGVGLVEYNLSKFKGGEPHYRVDDSLVCRAECKMLEVFDTFDFKTDKIKLACDLGAAPGGWSLALAERGIKVCSIDPADMDKRVLKNKNIKHFKTTSQEFVKNNKDKFDLIVNDMKMDAVKSVKITAELKPNLNKNAFVVITFKLPKGFTFDYVENCISYLQKYFKLITARQLFHNRNEITVIAQNA